jgi:hypothetical protein
MVLVLVSIGLLTLAVGEWLFPIGTAGIRVQGTAGDTRIEYLVDARAANAAGIHVGDRIDVQGFPFADRLRFFAGAVPGSVLHVRIAHGNGPFRDVAVTMNRRQTLEDGLAGHGATPRTVQMLAQAAGAIVAFGVAALIGWRRPSIAAAALVFTAAGTIEATRAAALIAWLPDPLFVPVALTLGALFAQLPAYAVLVFIAWFPHAPQTPGERGRATWAVAIFAAAFVFECAKTAYFKTYLPIPQAAAEISPWLAIAAVTAFTATAYVAATGETRRRVAWVLAGVVVSCFGLTIYNAIAFLPAAFISPSDRQWWYAAMSVVPMSFYIALAYAVLRHRVLDLGFVFNRTLVYGVMTTLVVVVVSLVDWVCGRFFMATGFTLVFEALVAIAVGVALNRLHSATERLVDRVVFRQRHLAETRLRQRATALAFAHDEADIDTTLACDACAILGLASAAVFRRDPDAIGRYQRLASFGWDDDAAAAVDAGSILVRSLLTEGGIVILDDLAIDHPGLPAGARRPALAVPVVFQSELLGFVLYGPHLDGTLPDPEELDLLRHLAKEAGGVYEIVELRRWRRSILVHPAIALR